MSTKKVTEHVMKELDIASLEDLVVVMNLDGFNINRAKNLSSGRAKKFKEDEIKRIIELTTLERENIMMAAAMEDADEYLNKQMDKVMDGTYVYDSKNLSDLSEEQLIALLPKDQQILVHSYRKLSDDKKKEHRDKIVIDATEAEISGEG